MAKIRQVLKDMSIETAKRKRICHRNRRKHEIKLGEKCLVIRNPATQSSKNYCVECGQQIIERATEDLEALAGELAG